MGGPYRVIVGGAAVTCTFPPADWLRVDNNATQSLLLVELEDYTAPGQINKYIKVDGLTRVTAKFSTPPNRTEVPNNGQIAQVWSVDAGAPGSPLGPSAGLLIPIGLDQPQHYHSHNHGPHHHTHTHGIGGDATGSSGHSHAHIHDALGHSHAQLWGNGTTGPASAGTAHTHGYNDPNGPFAGSGINTAATTLASDSTGESGHSHSHAHGGGTGSAGPDTTPATDTTLENVQHTHP